MISREILLNHLRGLEGIRTTGDDTFLMTVAWDGVDRLQDVTIEVGIENVAFYSAVAHADAFGADWTSRLKEAVSIPADCDLVLYEFFPPEYYWCIRLVGTYSQFEDLEKFRSVTMFLGSLADVIESKISNEDAL